MSVALLISDPRVKGDGVIGRWQGLIWTICGNCCGSGEVPFLRFGRFIKLLSLK